jgi:hypothetical protein
MQPTTRNRSTGQPIALVRLADDLCYIDEASYENYHVLTFTILNNKKVTCVVCELIPVLKGKLRTVIDCTVLNSSSKT